MKTPTPVFIGVASLLLPVGLTSAGGEETGTPILGVSIVSDRTAFVDGAYVQWKLTITNRSSKPVSLPSFWLIDTNTAHKNPPYVNSKILKVNLKQSSHMVPVIEFWRNQSGLVDEYPLREVQPGGVIHEEYLPSQFVDLRGAGEYSISIILDTTTCRDPKVTKGVWVAPPSTFHISPRLTFRAKKDGESFEEYAQVRASFFLKHSTPERDGWPLYLNEIVATQGAVPALIELSYSSDADIASRALTLLRRINLGRQRAVPDSKQAWIDWWRETGSRTNQWQLWIGSVVQ